jgi:hypothetical protein
VDDNEKNDECPNKNGSVQVHHKQSVRKIVDTWWAAESTKFNVKQKEVMQHIMQRVVAEDDEAIAGSGPITTPLSLLVCGGPGVGKSFVGKAAKGLFTALGWTQGIPTLIPTLTAPLLAILTSTLTLTRTLTPTLTLLLTLTLRQRIPILCLPSGGRGSN